MGAYSLCDVHLSNFWTKRIERENEARDRFNLRHSASNTPTRLSDAGMTISGVSTPAKRFSGLGDARSAYSSTGGASSVAAIATDESLALKERLERLEGELRSEKLQRAKLENTMRNMARKSHPGTNWR